jgi:16S rRNA (uracil1498-N3)-methyltransferase
MQLFYSEHIADKFVLTTEESKHLVKVLRKRVGDEVHFTNGTGGLFTCRVAIDNPKGALVEVVNSEEFEDKRPDLTLKKPVKSA